MTDRLIVQAPEVRPGSVVEAASIVLTSIRYQETGKIVHLLTLDHGRIGVFAPGAVLSRKRFGAALEPMSFIHAQLKFPRENGNGGLVQIVKADLRDSFLHLRQSSEMLETGAFAVRLIDEFIPEGQIDPQVFRATGRFLRDSEKLTNPAGRAGWSRFAFWNWMARHFGFGDLRVSLGIALPALSALLEAAWEKLMSEPEPDFGKFFMALQLEMPPKLSRRDEVSIYMKWTETTGVHWPHFEQWMKHTEALA